MDPQQNNVPVQIPEPSQPALPANPVVQNVPAGPVEPPKKKFPRVLLIIFIVLDLVAIAGAAWWFFVRDDSDQTTQNQTSQPQGAESDQAEDSAVQLATTTHESGLEHRSTASFEHPKDWTVIEETDAIFETYTLKSTTIVAPKGLRIKITDRDGIGGGCYPESLTYTLVKKLTTQTPGMSFKQFTVSGNSELSQPFFVLDTDGLMSNAAYDALKEGETITGECAVNTFSTVGRSGVFVYVMTDSSDNSVQTWDLIKDNAEFVRTLESMTAVDKSGN